MAQTRGATGNSKPRVFDTVSTEPTRKRKAGGPSAVTKAKATAKKATGAGVTKKRTTTKKPTIKDKVEGVVDKVEGAVERKPGKKAAGERKIRGTDKKAAKVV